MWYTLLTQKHNLPILILSDLEGVITKISDRGINYDEIADTYDQRYEEAYGPEGVAAALTDLARYIGAESILEVGCGTGHWLSVLQTVSRRVYGMDLSLGMLQKASKQHGAYHLIQGDVSQLPFLHNAFNMVFCVNALHHFHDPSEFVNNTRRLLKKGGTLSIIGMNPHAERDRWFLYDYFPGTYATDLDRYPSIDVIADWMMSAGFESIATSVAERILDTRMGGDVLPLPKNFTSQLTLLSQEAYAAGIKRIETALAEAEERGEIVEFPVDISLHMISGRKK